MPTLTRRSLLASLPLAAALPRLRAQAPAPLASFFVIGDTHFRAQEEFTAEMEPDSLLHTGGLVDALNRLPGKAQAFFHVRIGVDGLLVREYATRDGWATGFWTPQVWRATL